MKALVLLLLFLNIGLGLWVYGYSQPPTGVPLPLHADRLHLVSGVAPVSLPPTQAAPSKTAAPNALAVPPAVPVPKAPPRPVVDVANRKPSSQAGCWRLGPVPRRDEALRLLHQLHLTGHVLSRAGAPAYRIFLPAAIHWPSAQILTHLGVRGAYVTHGPAGGEVLSLGVFVSHAAATAELRHLRKGHLVAQIAPFGAPTHYYDEVRLARVPAGLWRRLGSVGHHLCHESHKTP